MTFLPLLLVLFFFPCCGVFEYTEVTVELPRSPSGWPDYLTDGIFVVRYLDSANIARPTVGEIEIGPGANSVCLRLPNLPVVPVAAAPLYGTPPAELKPCGAIFPGQLKEGKRLRLAWAVGFLAETLIDCAGTGSSMQAVNPLKLHREILSCTDGDPWRLDGDALKAAVESETLSYRSLRVLPLYDVVIEAAKGDWVHGNPLSRSSVEWQDGKVVFSGLPEGVHSFFRLGGIERIDISVGPSGWIAIYPVTGGGSAGNW